MLIQIPFDLFLKVQLAMDSAEQVTTEKLLCLFLILLKFLWADSNSMDLKLTIAIYCMAGNTF